MNEILQQMLNITLVVFMVGNLLEVGLSLKIDEARSAFRNLRFLVLTLLWCFVVGPALAILLTKIIPLAEPYALGMILLGMAPCTPAMPMMVRIAGGSVAYMSAFMVLAFTGTVVLMPVLVPVLTTGLTADAWTIAKPLVFFIALPLLVGVITRRIAKPVAGIDTVIMVVIMLWLYRHDLISSVGTYATATQLIYYGLLAVAVYALGFGFAYDQKSVMTIGLCTRNVGPAIAPLFAMADAPRGAIAMCILASPLGALLSGFITAAVLKRFFAPERERPPALAA
jgi:BASS family bile acid:Na+ symporter